MNLSKPLTAISPGVDADVLVVLAGSTMPRSGREMARHSGRSNTGVQHVLDRLVDHGLVNRAEVGRTYLYSLNRDHLLAPVVEQMADVRAELIRRLRDAIDGWAIPAVHASLFGSAARGDGNARSDIDLLIVLPAATLTPTPTNGATRSTIWPTWCAAGLATTPASRRSARGSFRACAKIDRLWWRTSGEGRFDLAGEPTRKPLTRL